MHHPNRLTVTALGLACLFCLVTPKVTKADIEPTHHSTTPVVGGFKWTYKADVTLNQRVEPGDFFTIYDFGGLIAGTDFAPAGWTFSSALVGATPPAVLPADDPSVDNLTWHWTGVGPAAIGPAFLGFFGAHSIVGASTITAFAGLGTLHDPGKPLDGTKIANVGSALAPAATPEPTTLALLGCGVLPFLRRLRRSTQEGNDEPCGN